MTNGARRTTTGCGDGSPPTTGCGVTRPNRPASAPPPGTADHQRRTGEPGPHRHHGSSAGPPPAWSWPWWPPVWSWSPPVPTEADNPGDTPTLATFTGTPTTEPGMAPTAGPRAIAAMVSDRPGLHGGPQRRHPDRDHRQHRPGGRVRRHHRDHHVRPWPEPGRSPSSKPDGTRQPAVDGRGATRPPDIAVLRIDDDLPAATFDDDDPPPARCRPPWPMTADPRTDAGARPGRLRRHRGVDRSGHRRRPRPPPSPPPRSRHPLDHDDIGCPLLDSSGPGVGILERNPAGRIDRPCRSSSPPSSCSAWPSSSSVGERSSTVVARDQRPDRRPGRRRHRPGPCSTPSTPGARPPRADGAR